MRLYLTASAFLVMLAMMAAAVAQVGGGGVSGPTTGPNLYVRSLNPSPFASLPTCAAGLQGALAAINDSSTVTWGATITGSSTNQVLGYCDGTNWTVAAK